MIDSGVGMDDVTRARVFEPLFTTKPIGRGTGLGLATCYAIVARLGGDITVRSTVGLGSEFILTLPTVPTKVERAAATPAPAAGHGPSVLLVDDQEFVLTPVALALQNLGYRVRTATSAKAALQILETEPMDVLVSDVIMPEIDGVELLARAQTLRPTLPAMLMTGFVDGTRELPEGVVVLFKPFRPRELAFQIDQLLNARASDQTR